MTEKKRERPVNKVPNEVPAFEHGRLRLYEIKTETGGGQELIAALRADPRDAHIITSALGADRVDPYWIDYVKAGELGELGLDGYLREGYGLRDADLGRRRVAPEARHVLIVPSRAFGDAPQTLSPSDALVPLAMFDTRDDTSPRRPFEPAASARSDRSSDARLPETPPAGRSDRRMRPGSILVLLLIAAAFIFLVTL